MPRLTHFGLCCLALVLIAGAVSHAADTPAASPPAAKAAPPAEATPGNAPPKAAAPATSPKAPAEIAPARFEATAYEVLVPADRAGKLDSAALTAKAADPDDLRKSLAEFGPTRILYRVDQPVNLYSENIMIGSREPMVTATRKTDTGQSINTVQYRQVGLIVNISAGPPPKDSDRKGLDVQMKIELAAIGQSAVEISPQARAAVVRNVVIDHSESLRFGRPFVMLNVTYPQTDEKDSAVVYVIRGLFNEAKP
jgi:hypothetical protein